MLVKISAKECKSYVNYTKPSKTVYEVPIKLNTNINKIQDSNQTLFQVLNPNQEVIHESLRPKQNKRVNRWLKSLTLSASSFLVAIPVSAAETTDVIVNLPSQSDLLTIGQWAINYMTGAVIIGGALWVVATRVLHFPAIKKYRDMALDIATNTIKGITEAILIPTLIIVIVGVSILLFGGIGVFNLPL